MTHATAIDTATLGIETPRKGGWFTRLATYYLQTKAAAPPRDDQGVSDANAAEAARALIFRACLKSALVGAAAGTVSTAATLATAESGGAAALLTVPFAALAMAGDAAYRSFVHVELTCDIALAFRLDIDYENPDDLWRLFALVFKAAEHDDESSEPGKELLGEVTSLEAEEIGESVGRRVLGESVARNVLPFVSVFASAMGNYVVTKRLGDTVRRYMRYQRALHDALNHAAHGLKEHLGLLIEGLWFIFTADGKLTPEETVMLARWLDRLTPAEREAVQARFVEDELEWAQRIEVIAEAARPGFLHALEVAAAVDKHVGLPERKILRRAARHLGLDFDMARLDQMIAEFDEHGVLRRSHGRPHVRGD